MSVAAPFSVTLLPRNDLRGCDRNSRFVSGASKHTLCLDIKASIANGGFKPTSQTSYLRFFLFNINVLQRGILETPGFQSALITKVLPGNLQTTRVAADDH